MIYLCEKYKPLEGLPKYDPREDPSSGEDYMYGKGKMSMDEGRKDGSA